MAGKVKNIVLTYQSMDPHIGMVFFYYAFVRHNLLKQHHILNELIQDLEEVRNFSDHTTNNNSELNHFIRSSNIIIGIRYYITI